MPRVALLNVVGLSRGLLQHAPRIAALGNEAAKRYSGPIILEPIFPAVTCSVQASMLTGLDSGGDASGSGGSHGIVGNGWYDREADEIRFWQRSARLMRGDPVWDEARRQISRDIAQRATCGEQVYEAEVNPHPAFTCANLGWWHNTYSTCEFVVQVRPIYKADGRKLPDCYTRPPELRDRLQAELGQFPLFQYWGPAADLTGSSWFADAARLVEQWHSPTLSLVYLPHLDYPLQRLGPDHPDIPGEILSVDTLVGDLIDFYRERGVHPIVVSEYGIEPCIEGDASIAINRHLRERGLLAVRLEDGHEVLDPGASRAFAVVDHQVAHLYMPNGPVERDALGLDELPLDVTTQLDHPRAGNLVLVADEGRWFCYDYWPTDRPDLAPDYARTVAIHDKPGYDPRELFLDPAIRFPKLALGRRLLAKRLGMRTLMDVIPLDNAVVRGTHGRPRTQAAHEPVMLGAGQWTAAQRMSCRKVREVLLRAISG